MTTVGSSRIIDATDRRRTSSVASRCVTAAYIFVATVLVWSRFSSVRSSLWHDEIFTVQHYIVPGPGASFGRYGTNDHILFSVLCWLTVHLVRLPESAYRLWSILPFIAGVTVVATWLDRRAGPAIGILFALLSTFSTQLLILSSEARGYGLAFFAMAVMTVAAYEASTRHGSGSLTLSVLAGIVGCWTLPTFVLPFAATAGVLLRQQALRRRLLLRLIAAGVALGAWYAVPFSALIASRGQEFGVHLPWHAPLTGGATELAAAFLWVTFAGLIPALVTLPVLILGLIAARRAMPGLAPVVAAPVVLTFLALTAARVFVEARFVSYLLVPLFIVGSFGLKALLSPRPGIRWIASATYAGSMLALAVLVFAIVSVRHARLPQEANREAADAVAAGLAAAARPVIFNTAHPQDILYYLQPRLSVSHSKPGTVERAICAPNVTRTGVIFVQQPFDVEVVDTSCLASRGAVVHVFRQWDRGLRISVWELPRGGLPTPSADVSPGERRATLDRPAG